MLCYCVLHSSENPALVLVKPWQSEQEKAETSVVAIQRSPLASRPDVLVPQETLNGARSEAVALIR